jgi:hypothetical protein
LPSSRTPWVGPQAAVATQSASFSLDGVFHDQSEYVTLPRIIQRFARRFVATTETPL